ncbi:hypothetical protein ANN_21829 [Periplaneta americana]|uniref:Uncharacterized protein n=1 Tax=Periplaneta americana TaxID=6978 RepID=A0ABQ8S6H4_PERAM|nr:hypothetical protein ANN_21829 [Periplaneta americana]
MKNKTSNLVASVVTEEESDYIPDTDNSSSSGENKGAGGDTAVHVNSASPARLTTEGQHHADNNENRGRKRTKNEESWKRNLRKKHRNSGQQYVSKKGIHIPGKVFDTEFNCNCPRKCKEKISMNDHRKCFTSFWNLGDFSKQNVYLRGLVQVAECQRSRPRDNTSTPKSNTFKAVTKTEVFAVIDSRGKNTSVNKIDDSDVINYIRSFPAYQSHYSRRDNSGRKYLNPDLNIRKMYDLYLEKCQQENKTPVKQKFYYNVFSTKFNLHFKPPYTDTCRLCDELEMKISNECNEGKALKVEKELHLASAEQARGSMRSDEENACNEMYVATFDLQKALPFPKLTTSTAYYKRNMYVYNFGIHSFNQSTAFMYMWDETEGGRGSQEIASCIRSHLKMNASSHNHIILYSDACSGQNRNIKMALTLLKLVNDTEMQVEIIDHKFMVSGHSFLPNDADFGLIEKAASKTQYVYGPEDWFNVVKSAKRKEPKFEVIVMKRDNFISTNSLEQAITNRKQTIDGYEVNWLKIRWMRYERGMPFTMRFKERLSELVEFSKVNFMKKRKGNKLHSLAHVHQELLYKNQRLVTNEKKKNMLDLLKFIPPLHHAYYKNLQTANIVARGRSQNNQEDLHEHDDSLSGDEMVFV